MGVEMKAMASEQVERANERDRKHVSLAADVASSAVLLGIVILVTVALALPVALVIGVALP